ncbi:dUTP diphosphatase [Pseudoramibacter sp.]|jgi:dUTP pyrophosphatase|uniref:dUTP diphosphatase n=1 Tax=Pseudoramibacter sp. TaxID=2034862 RepID=UPI0025E73910|nr:dUTP diphosphatase [Pseudoramibacter sp.]MCH4072588.1 dUTP diphosphatase [Pseudoramibacter sp.]MCH4106359.1 dUTP diphosphatase [Pseudoramibacter sp.]
MEIKKLRPQAKIPFRGSEHAAGVDLFACVDEAVTIAPHQTAMIPTGLAIALPEKTFGAVFARSGLAVREGLRPANCVGVIDEDYRGEVTVALYNDSDAPRTVEPEERIAQLVIVPYVMPDMTVVDELDQTERGKGGFGSTGK